MLRAHSKYLTTATCRLRRVDSDLLGTPFERGLTTVFFYLRVDGSVICVVLYSSVGADGKYDGK